VEIKTTPAKPSILHWMLGTAMLAFVAGVMLMTFLPYLVQFSTGVLS
jgi:hypothetical protein